MSSSASYAVKIFDNSTDPALQQLRKDGQIHHEVDVYEHALLELFDIAHPWLKPSDTVYEKTQKTFLAEKKKDPQDRWVYYPWSKTLIHAPAEEIFNLLRTSRNRNLITPEEQKILQSKKVGIAGMSVGSNILNTFVLTGGPRHLKICDFDEVSIPNLNRIMAPVSAVGLNKAVYFARKSLEVDPYVTVEAFDKGLREEDFESFFGDPALDLFVEEMDNPYLKIASRKIARARGIPVIMAADNGDGVLIDVERYDLDKSYPYFHGALDKIVDIDTITPKLSFSKKLAIIANMVHLEEATPRAQDSLSYVGTVLNTWPQLGTAAVMAGVSLTYVARRILLGLPMPSGRYHITLEDSLEPDYLSAKNKGERAKHTHDVMTSFKSFQEFLDKVANI